MEARTVRLAGAALLTVILVIAGLASAAPPARTTAAVSVSVKGQTYTTVAALARQLAQHGITFDAYVNSHPSIAKVFGLRPVKWDGKRFWTPAGMRRWHLRHHRSFSRWETMHPASAAQLRRNMRARVARTITAAYAAAPTDDVRIAASADTYVDSSKPRYTYGSSFRLRVDNSPTRRAYVRFDPPAISGTVQKIRLAVYSASSTAGFVATPVAAGSWNESSNWASAPAPAAGGVRSPSASGDSWAIVDVTGKVSLGGPVSFALTAVDNRDSQFGTRETSLAALLLVDTATTTPPPPPPPPPPVMPASSTAPAVSGTAAVGSSVTVSNGTWTGTTPMTYAYSWQRCNSTGGACAPIGGASGSSYPIVATDAGSTLRGVVAATNAAGTTSATSAPTAVVTSTSPPPPPPPPPPSGNRFGLASGGIIEWASDGDLSKELDGYKSIGAGWIRFDLKWSVVEGTKGSYNWSNYDRVVNAAKARGLSVVFSVAYTPGWARVAGATDDKYPPANVADYANFAKLAVQHFSPQGVKVYEIWNEVNLPGFWKPAPDPVKYTALVKAAYPAMKSADSSITVLVGAFSPAGGYNDPNCNGTASSTINGITFLEKMYANGAKGYFDALSHHPYYGGGGPRDTHRCNAWAQMATTSPSLRSLMTANGDSDKKIWATESGSDLFNDEGGNETNQANHMKDAMGLWLTYPWAGPMMVYAYHQSLDGYNLVRSDWSPRQAWYAFQSAPKQ